MEQCCYWQQSSNRPFSWKVSTVSRSLYARTPWCAFLWVVLQNEYNSSQEHQASVWTLQQCSSLPNKAAIVMSYDGIFRDKCSARFRPKHQLRHKPNRFFTPLFRYTTGRECLAQAGNVNVPQITCTAALLHLSPQLGCLYGECFCITVCTSSSFVSGRSCVTQFQPANFQKQFSFVRTHDVHDTLPY